MGTTNTYGWAYPEATDAPDGASQIQALAEDAEATLNGIESTKIPTTPIGWTTLTLSGTGVTDGGYRRIQRLATGQVELQLRVNITTSSLNVVAATVPSWARPTGADKRLCAATNNQNGAGASVDVSASTGAVTLRFNNLSGTGLFIEVNETYTP